MLKSGPLVHKVREMGGHYLQAGEDALCRSNNDTNNACKMHSSRTTPLILMAQRSATGPGNARTESPTCQIDPKAESVTLEPPRPQQSRQKAAPNMVASTI